MVFGLFIFESISYCDGMDDDLGNNQQSQSNSSTQNTKSTSSNLPSQQTQSTSTTQATPSTNSTEHSESTVKTVLNSAKEISLNIAKFGENYIPYSVGGAVAGAVLKYSSGAPLPHRVVAATAAAGMGVLTSGIAGSMVKGLNNAREDFESKRRADNARLEDYNRTGSSATLEGGNSGGDSNFTANSPLDSGEMNNPLIEILDNLILFNVLELLIILVIIFFTLNIILKNRLGLILLKYVPSKYKKIHNIISKLTNTSGIIDFIFILGFLLLLLIVKFTGIYLSIEIKNNIDALIYFYTEAKKK